jgi:hypothetical protein
MDEFMGGRLTGLDRSAMLFLWWMGAEPVDDEGGLGSAFVEFGG